MKEKAAAGTDAFSVRNDMVVRLVGDVFVPVIPDDATDLIQGILRKVHASALGGHLGRRKMEALLRSRFYWTSMARDIRVFCAQCDVCQRMKVVTQAPIGLL